VTGTIVGTGWFPEDTGGLPRYVRGLAESLGDMEVVVTGPAPGAPDWVRVAAPRTAGLLRRLLAFRAATPADGLVDVHFALYGAAAIAGRRPRPLVVHFHGPWAAEAVAANAARGTALRTAIERFVYRRADAAVTLSYAFADVLADHYGVDRSRISVIAPGVDLDTFTPDGQPKEGFVVVCPRRLVPRMGVDVLLEAWRRAEIPGAQLFVVGDGPDRTRLEALAPAGVRFTGSLEDAELVAAYRRASVVVVPSIALEGFGLVVLEALACGTPVLVSDSGGLPETVAALDRSCVVPAGDPAALAARLREAAAGNVPSAEACRAHAERFTWTAAAEAHRALYRGLGRRRVVFLDHTAVLAGGEIALVRLVRALDVDAHVILGGDGPLAQELRDAGATVEILPLHEGARGLGRESVGAPLAAILSFLYALRLSARLRRLRPDVVHCNSLKANLYGGLAARLARVPVVWHVRDRISPDYLPARAISLVRAAERLLADAVVVDTESVRATLARPERAQVVPSPVPAMAAGSRDGAPLRVGMLGRIAPWKGQHVFLDAFAAAFPDGDAEAVVIGAPLFGSDEEDYERSLRARAESLGIAGRVEFRGFRADTEAELARLDVLVHASVLDEPFGLAVVEGMAAGLPVVAAAGGGPAEVVTDGVDGLLYPAGDADALAARLRTLAGDATLRRALGNAARSRAAAFAPEVAAARMLEIYESLR
jgi:glycosyltransferase involved in cell wall biosynthesis